MPTKKRRVGFIPRSDVLDLINKLSYESNLSYSKVINILVEEALLKRGLFNIKKGNNIEEKSQYKSDKLNLENKRFNNQEFNYNFKEKKIFNNENLNFNEVKEETLDNEIYSKFLLFLQFQEKMKLDN